MRESLSFKVSRVAVLGGLIIFVAVPLYVILVSSFKPLKDVSGQWTWWPENFTIAPYITMWETVPLANYFVNSVIISVAATALALTFGILAAFALTRLRWKGQRAFSLIVLSTQMFPGILFLLPLYLIFVQIQRVFGVQLIGNYGGMIITYTTFALPFAIWMLMGFFAAMPEELEEAGDDRRVDTLRRLHPHHPSDRPTGNRRRRRLRLHERVGRGALRLGAHDRRHPNALDRHAGLHDQRRRAME